MLGFYAQSIGHTSQPQHIYQREIRTFSTFTYKQRLFVPRRNLPPAPSRPTSSCKQVSVLSFEFEKIPTVLCGSTEELRRVQEQEPGGKKEAMRTCSLQRRERERKREREREREREKQTQRERERERRQTEETDRQKQRKLQEVKMRAKTPALLAQKPHRHDALQLLEASKLEMMTSCKRKSCICEHMMEICRNLQPPAAAEQVEPCSPSLQPGMRRWEHKGEHVLGMSKASLSAARACPYQRSDHRTDAHRGSRFILQQDARLFSLCICRSGCQRERSHFTLKSHSEEMNTHWS
ncbi:putative uncharacterized protein DDB_G0271982 [Hippoglossus hippoglossus]|uniref:putative uncharacterized protein DDB_G0271982 n=1 Tax=Hippoglossus hippoglossus TaxID=8267 RepID=UPI00148E6BDD|nr:putative uncharacterized protein DDB_G0271982 [Hippoglossus hippoglossus]